MILDPKVVFLNVGGVHDQQEMIRLELLVNQKVIDCTAVGVEHHPVKNLAGSHGTDIVGEHVVHEFLGVRATDEYLTHVGDIEHSDLVTDRQMLLGDGRILDRHIKAGKRAHLGS